MNEILELVGFISGIISLGVCIVLVSNLDDDIKKSTISLIVAMILSVLLSLFWPFALGVAIGNILVKQ